MGALTLEKKHELIIVERRVWDPTEGFHSRHGERPLGAINGLEVHWVGPGSVGDHGDTGTELLSFEAFHEITKGWYDLFYQVGCDTEGITYEGRDWTIPSQSDLYNWLTFLVVLGSGDSPTAAELAAIEARIVQFWRAIDPSLSPHTLRTHGMRASTACPGQQIQAIVNRLRANPPHEPRPLPSIKSQGEDMIYYCLTGLVPHCYLSYGGTFRHLTATTVFGQSPDDPKAWSKKIPTVPVEINQLAALRKTARLAGHLQDDGLKTEFFDDKFFEECPYTRWPQAMSGGGASLGEIQDAISQDGRSTRDLVHREHEATRAKIKPVAGGVSAGEMADAFRAAAVDLES